MITPLFLALSLVSLVAGQGSDLALDIEAIEAHFSNAGLVPSLLSTFDPIAVMSVSFDGVGVILPGQALSKDQVSPTPTVTIAPANSSVSLGNSFTITMVDADVVGTDESKGQTRHWLVNGATLSGSSSNETVSNASAVAITEYAGPAPASGSGAHRYVILLYTQPSSFSPPSNLSQSNIGVSVFSLTDYVSTSGLVGPVAGMYFTVSEGTATVSVSGTSAVKTSTLPVPSSATSGSKTATSSGSAASESANAAVGFVKVNEAITLIGILAACLFV